MGIFLVKMTLTVLRIKSGLLKMDAVLTKFQNLISLFRYLSVRDAFQKKKSPYGGTLSQLGGEGVKINFKMSLLKIPFY